jgi:hypothetical protein
MSAVALRRVSVAAACAGLACVVAACSTQIDGRGARSDPGTGGFGSGAPTASPSAASSTAHSSAPSPANDFGAILEKMALKTSDFQSGNTMELIDGGDEVDGEVTLDNCGFTFTTEADRVARRQYALFDSDDDAVGLSNELVAYDTPAAAAKALAEWHTAAATCPAGVVHTQDEPDATFKVSRNDLGAAGLPVSTNGVTIESVNIKTETDYEAVILQLDGRFLDIVYLDQDDALTPADVTSVLAIASVTGQRMVTNAK